MSQISVIDNQLTHHSSSVGISPTGPFDVRSKTPAAAPSTAATTHFVSRVAIPDATNLPWQLVIGEAQPQAGEFRGRADELTLAFSPCPPRTSTANRLLIRADFHWRTDVGPLHSHASLVAAYEGPGDTHMFAAMLQPHPAHSVDLSLWKSTDRWEQLATETVLLPGDREMVHCPLWLQVDAALIRAGIQPIDSTEMEPVWESAIQTNYQLPHIATYGLRMSGDQISATYPTASWIPVGEDA
ncbi:MAG: hypothetical protein R3C53_25215 [Pirellulaceae bacterium]